MLRRVWLHFGQMVFRLPCETLFRLMPSRLRIALVPMDQKSNGMRPPLLAGCFWFAARHAVMNEIGSLVPTP